MGRPTYRLRKTGARAPFQFELLEPRHLFSASPPDVFSASPPDVAPPVEHFVKLPRNPSELYSAPPVEHFVEPSAPPVELPSAPPVEHFVEPPAPPDELPSAPPVEHFVEPPAPPTELPSAPPVEPSAPPAELHSDQGLTNFNWLPMVFLGADRTTSISNSLTLAGDVVVNGIVNLSVAWRKVSGPGSAAFSSPTGASSSVQFDQVGTYELELAATNAGLTAYDRVFVTVTAANVIDIDQAWLAAQGAGPYVLKDAGKTYRLQTDVTTPGSAFYIADHDITLDLNGHEIHYGGNNAANTHGVILYISWHNTEIVIPGAELALNFVLKNGEIINDGAGDHAHGIYGYQADGVLIQDMEITTDGKDSHTAYFVYSYSGNGGATIRDSILTTNTSSTFDRHAGPANVLVGGVLVAEGNVLIGGNSGFFVGANSVIHGNVIAHNSFATNGYGVFTYETHGVTITDNLILPTNGRGILFNAGENNTATGNVILHLESPNPEFGEELNPPAVRSRYGTTGMVYSGNTSLGIGGGDHTSASSIYISKLGGRASRFENNDATVILVGAASRTIYAQPLTLEGTRPYSADPEHVPGTDVIANNHFKSNHLMIRVEGYDGYTQQIEPLKGNSYDWVNGATAHEDFMAAVTAKLGTLALSSEVLAAAQTHVATIDELVEDLIDGQDLQANRAVWQAKYVSHDTVTYVDVLDSNWGPGVDPKSYAYGFSGLSQGAVKIREGFTRNVQVLSNGTPVANSVVNVSTQQSDSYEATTDANGFVTLTFYRFSIEKALPEQSPFTVIDRTHSTISVGASSVQVDHANVPNQIDVGAGAVGQSLELHQPQQLQQPDSVAWLALGVDGGAGGETSDSTDSAGSTDSSGAIQDAALDHLNEAPGLLALAVTGLADGDDSLSSLSNGKDEPEGEGDQGFAHLADEWQETLASEITGTSRLPGWRHHARTTLPT